MCKEETNLEENPTPRLRFRPQWRGCDCSPLDDGEVCSGTPSGKPASGVPTKHSRDLSSGV